MKFACGGFGVGFDIGMVDDDDDDDGGNDIRRRTRSDSYPSGSDRRTSSGSGLRPLSSCSIRSRLGFQRMNRSIRVSYIQVSLGVSLG